MMRQALAFASEFKTWIVVVCLLGSAAPLSASGDEEEKGAAAKYHAVLQKRPEPGYLFDRFYNAWLDESTAESLQAFLEKQANQSHAVSDRLLLAFFHSKQNNDRAAIEEIDKALAQDPANAAAWYYKAQAEARTLDFDSAIADLRRAGAQKSSDKLAVAISRQLGTMLLRNRQTKEALDVWKSLLAANPGDEELVEEMIELHIEESLFSEAASLLNSLIARTKDPYTAVMRRLRLGDVYHRAGQRQKALEVYASTLSESGQDTWLEREILAQIEQIYRMEDDLSGLKKQYASLVEKYPKRVGLQRRQCRLLAELGEQDEAIKSYRALLERMPGDRDNREQFVEMLCRAGKFDEAVAELEALAKQNPKDAELQVRLARTLHQAKQPAKAAEAARQYLKLSDGSEYAYLRAAHLVESVAEKKDEAQRLYQAMVAAFPDSPSAKEAQAAFLFGNGQKDEALSIWKALAQKADLNQLLGIARALESRGENAAALELLEARRKDFDNDPLFLNQLVNEALRQKQYEKATAWARQRVELAKSVAELEGATAQVVTACQQCNRVEPLISELKGVSNRSIPLTCLLAELQESVGDSAQADALLKGLAEKGEVLAVGEQVRLFTLRGDWPAAAGATRRLLDLSGGRQSQQVRRLVELYERDGRFEEALKWIETWKRQSPGATTPWLAEARLLQHQGKEAELLKTLRKAIQRFEQNDELRVRLAQAYQESGKTSEAERVYWLLYEKTNDAGGKLRWAGELARLAQANGTIPQLADNFRQRSRSNRQSIVPLLALAEIYRTVDDSQNRRQALMAATKLKPDDLQLLTEIARLEELEGEWKSAVATLEQAAKLDKTPQTRQKIAHLHITFGNPDTGYAMLRELLGDHAADPRVLERLADSLCANGEWKRAVDVLRPRLADHSGDYRLRYLLAVALEEETQQASAIDQFVLLLENQEELDSVKKAASKGAAPPQASYLDLFSRILPSDASAWIKLHEHRYAAYSYRQSHSGRVYLGAGVRPAGFIPLPPSVETVRDYALIHLLSLGRELEKSQRAALVAAMKTRGIRTPDLLLKLGLEESNGLTPNLDEAMEAYPDNESLLALAVLLTVQERPERAEDVIRAFKTFRDKRPELALMAGVEAASHDAKHAALFDEAMALAAKIDDPSPLVVMGLTRVMGAQPWADQETNSVLTKEQRAKVVRLLVAWYPKLSQSPLLPGPWAFVMIASALRGSDEPQPYLAMLEGEVAAWRKNPSKSRSQSQNMFSQHQSNRSLIEPLAFPPAELADFPPNVVALLAPGPNNPFGSAATASDAPEWEGAKLEPLIRKVKDPTLRVLLAHRFELPKLFDATLAEMLAAKPPQLDAYLLAAGKACADSKFVEAIDLLDKARNLPMNEETRRRLDAALAASAIAAKETAPAARREELLKSGRDAALRLRRQRLDAEQRSQLVVALQDLGLKDEAQKLDKLISGILSAFSPGASAYSGPASSSPTPTDRINKLLSSGQRDAAVRLLVGEVRSLRQQMASNPGSASWLRNQMRELKTRCSVYGLLDDVVKALDPGQTDNPVRLSEWAMACELFERPAEARKAYERVLEIRPKDDAARARLILLLLSTPDGAKAVDLQLAKISESSGALLGQLLNEGVNDNDGTWEERLRYAEAAFRLLAAQKERSQADVAWVNSFLPSFGRQHYSNRGQRFLPSLYEHTPQQDREHIVDAATLQRRAKLHHDLCLVMIDIPEAARTGFQHLLAAAEARGDLPELSPPSNERKGSGTGDAAKSPPGAIHDTADDLQRLAEKALLAEAVPQSRHAGRGGITFYHYFGSSGDPDEVRFRDPEEYLACRAWRKGDWTHLETELLPKLGPGRNKQAARSLERLMKLYRCPEPEFLEAARAVIAQAGSPGMPMIQMESNEGLSTVVDVWADRKLGVDLQPVLLDSLRRSLSSRSFGNTPGVPIRYVETLVARGKRAQAEAFLKELATLFLGPAEKREELVKKHHSPQGGYSSGSPAQKIQSFVNLLDTLAQRDSLLFLVLDLADSLPALLMQGSNLPHRVQQTMDRAVDKSKKPEAVVAWLESSPWLGDVRAFRILSTGDRADQWPLVHLLRQSPLVAEGQSQPVWAALDAKQKTGPTFGRGLFLAVKAQARDQNALIALVAKHLSEIKALPQPQQESLCLLVNELLSKNPPKGAGTDPSWQAARQWLDRSAAERSSRLVEKLRNAKRLQDLGLNDTAPWQISRYLGDVLPGVIPNDPKAGVAIFLQTVKLVEDAQKRNRSGMYSSDDDSTEGAILRHMLQETGQRDFQPAWIPFLIDLLATPEGSRASVDVWTIRHLVQQFVSRCDRQGPTKSPQERLARIYAELGSTLGGRSSAILLPGLWESIAGQLGTEKQYQQSVAWVKEEMQKGKYPALAADLYACIRLDRDSRRRKKPQGADALPPQRLEMADYHQHFQKLIARTDGSLPERVSVASFLIDHEGARALPLPLTIDAARLYVDALEKRTGLSSEQQRAFLQLLAATHDGETPKTADSAAAQAVAAASKEILDKWRERFAARYLSATSSALRLRGGGAPISDHNVLCLALHVYLASGDSDHTAALFSKCESAMVQSPAVLAALVRYGKTDRAAQFFRAHAATLQSQWYSAALRYDAAMAKSVAAFLPGLPNDGDRFAAEALLATMPDPPTDKKQAVSPREQRLVAAATRFKDVKFTDASRKLQAIRWLVGNDKAAAILADEVAAEYKKIKVEQFQLNYGMAQHEALRPILEGHIRNRLLAGDPGPLAETLEKLSRDMNNADYIFHQVGFPLLNACYDVIQKGQTQWTADQAKRIATVLRGTTTNRENIYFNDSQKFALLLLVAHVQAGQADELIAWYRDLPANGRSQLNGFGDPKPAFEFLRKSGPAPSKENLARRMGLIRDTLKVCVKNGWSVWNPERRRRVANENVPFFDSIAQSGLMTAEELIEHGAELTAKLDDGGPAKAALAAWLARKKQPDKAIPLWREAIAALPEKNRQEAAQWRWDLAQTLKTAGKLDEAKRVAGEIKEAMIAPQRRSDFRKLRAELGISQGTAP